MNIRMPRGWTLAAATIVMLGGAVPASADSFSLTYNPSPTQYVGSGQTVTGAFNINGLVTPTLFTQPYDIVAASMTFFFRDDGSDPTMLTGQTGGGYQYTGGSGCYGCNNYSNYTQYVSRSFLEEGETAYVYTAGNGASATSLPGGMQTQTSTVWNGSSTQPYTYSYTYSYSCGWSTCYSTNYYTAYNTTNYYTQYTDTTQLRGGAFSLTQALSSASIADLAVDGVLNFSIQGAGDFFFESAMLTFDVNRNPISSVPEPATLAVIGSGLFGLGVRRWRQHRRQA